MRILPVKTIVLIVICFSMFVYGAETTPSAKQSEFNELEFKNGVKHYEKNKDDKALVSFKKALAKSFAMPASEEVKSAVSLIKASEPAEAEKKLLMLFDSDSDSARARYELGLIYEKQGKTGGAATLLRNALEILAGKGARYTGVKNCKKCHFGEYRSWKKTKMAQTFDTLKPGVKAEAKTKMKLDPKKDYTKNSACLSCHTTGFGMPGGYKIPTKSDSKSKATAKENEGVTCEGCHGPGSKYLDIHDDIKNKKRQYHLQEMYNAGLYKIEPGVCTTCHNRRNLTATADYHFDFERYKDQDTHEILPLKYRAD